MEFETLILYSIFIMISFYIMFMEIIIWGKVTALGSLIILFIIGLSILDIDISPLKEIKK